MSEGLLGQPAKGGVVCFEAGTLCSFNLPSGAGSGENASLTFFSINCGPTALYLFVINVGTAVWTVV